MLLRYAVLVLLCSCAATPVANHPQTPPPGPGRPAAAPAAAPVARGAYLGEVAADAPKIFAPGIVSRHYQELNAAFSPSGDELFFTLADAMRTHYTLLYMARRPDGTWQGPAVAPFSGRYADADPMFTADGNRLYFISKRPTTPDPAPKDFDIWYVDRAGGGWGEPVNVGPPINTPDNEYYVSVTRTGTLYWSRKGDIQRGVPTGDGYRVETLGPAVNSKVDEFDPFVAADESYLIFGSGGRPDSLGSADLYVSFRVDGEWQPARSLGPTINSTAFEYCPIVSPDGTRFFFTSYRRSDAGPRSKPATLAELLTSMDAVENGLGNIYWMDAAFLDTMRRGAAPP